MNNEDRAFHLADWFANHMANPTQENIDKLLAFVEANQKAVDEFVTDYRTEKLQVAKADAEQHLDSINNQLSEIGAVDGSQPIKG